MTPSFSTPDLDSVRGSVERLADELRERGAGGQTLAFVLGSGLGSIADRLTDRVVIPGDTLEHLPRPRVSGHAGALILGRMAGVPVLVQSGRVHLYEGRSPHEVTRTVRAFARLGIRAVVLTNASGGLVAEWAPGTLLAIRDHLNFQGRTPLWKGEGARQAPWDERLTSLLTTAADGEIPIRSGVYAGLLGPSYETPAEIQALRRLGAHAVGMSTVAEACAARAAGMRVVGVSCISNLAAGIGTEVLRHEDVLANMQASAERLGGLFERLVPAWAEELRPRRSSYH